MNEDADFRKTMPDARYQALRRIFAEQGVAANQIDTEIARYLRALAMIEVPSDAELQVKERKVS